jgi:hypothetical protein
VRRLVAAISLLTIDTSSWVYSKENCAQVSQVVPISTVLTHANKFDGRQVTVRGLFFREVHGSILSTPECPHMNVTLRLSSDFKSKGRSERRLNSITRSCGDAL